MHPILVSTGALTITAHGTLLSLGVLAGAGFTLAQARREHLMLGPTIDVLLAALVGGMIGARLGYVWIHWPYFADHLDEVWRFWLGGLAWHGGLIGGASGAAILARYRLRQPALVWLDRLAPGAALATVFGWLGCWLAACGYGREMFPGDAIFSIAVDSPDTYGVWAPRLPSQWLGAAWGLSVFLALWRLCGTQRLRPGARFAAFVGLYSFGSWLVGFTRGDFASPTGAGNIEHAIDAFLFCLGTLATSIALMRPPRLSSELRL